MHIVPHMLSTPNASDEAFRAFVPHHTLNITLFQNNASFPRQLCLVVNSHDVLPVPSSTRKRLIRNDACLKVVKVAHAHDVDVGPVTGKCPQTVSEHLADCTALPSGINREKGHSCGPSAKQSCELEASH